MTVRKAAGARVHLLIAVAVSHGGDMDVTALAKEMWKLAPVGGTIRSGVQVSCVSKASMYLKRVRPGSDWALLGAEVPLGGGRADLVWQDRVSGDVVVDEIKTGPARIGDSKVAEQVTRFCEGGADQWGSSFVGVRLVSLTAPALTAVWALAGDRLRPVADDRLAVR